MNSMPIRILHVLGSSQVEATGIAEIVVAIASSLDRSKYLSEVVFLDRHGPLVARFEDRGIAAHIISWRHPHRDPFGYFRFWRFLAGHPYDIVHFHWGGNRLQRLAHKRSKVVVHLHGRIDESRGDRIVSVPTQHADAVIAVCKAVAAQTQQANVHTIYSGVPEQSAFRPAPECMTIGFAGRLVRLKGCHVLLQAIRLLVDEFPQIQLQVAGSGPEQQDLERLARSLDITSSVHFLGWQQDLGFCLSVCNIFAQPSLEEGLPIGLLHAMASGMPAIATSVGGVPEVIDDQINGRLVPPRNPLALADAIRDLLLSPAKRTSLGQAAAETIKQRFSNSKMASQVASLYSEVLKARS
jgi:glycosyltransferase involved in cell wall biosynthesis